MPFVLHPLGLRLSRLARTHIAPHSPCLPAGRLDALSGAWAEAHHSPSHRLSRRERLKVAPRSAKGVEVHRTLDAGAPRAVVVLPDQPPVAEVSALGGFDIGEATSVCARTGQSISPWWCETSTPITPYHSRAVSIWGWAS